MKPVECLINTGTGPNLVNRTILPPTRISRIRRQQFLEMKNEKQQPISLEIVTMLHLRICDLFIPLHFGFVENLAIEVLLETLFIN